VLIRFPYIGAEQHRRALRGNRKERWTTCARYRCRISEKLLRKKRRRDVGGSFLHSSMNSSHQLQGMIVRGVLCSKGVRHTRGVVCVWLDRSAWFFLFTRSSAQGEGARANHAICGRPGASQCQISDRPRRVLWRHLRWGSLLPASHSIPSHAGSEKNAVPANHR
jgi:hypothetical protein